MVFLCLLHQSSNCCWPAAAYVYFINLASYSSLTIFGNGKGNYPVQLAVWQFNRIYSQNNCFRKNMYLILKGGVLDMMQDAIDVFASTHLVRALHLCYKGREAHLRSMASFHHVLHSSACNVINV